MATTRMSRSEIDDFLENRGTGVLSLAYETDAYAVPESFGYDGEHLYFQLVYDDDSRKMACIDATDTVTFTAFTQTPPRSVIVRGALEAVSAEDEPLATEVIAENADVPTLNVLPDSQLEDLTTEHYRLVPEELSGRKFGASFL
jgi:nitroimidazol reductase NimA-like FMN-containing flavoprotein (pyridoxamine 5'-phosphate oxidase superfamily)